MSQSPLAQFDAAIQKVTQDRGAVYGHPADDFRRATLLKMVVAECPDPLVRHALEMICVKMARLIHTPTHLDSLIDIAGYARTAVMCFDRPQRDAAGDPTYMTTFGPIGQFDSTPRIRDPKR